MPVSITALKKADALRGIADRLLDHANHLSNPAGYHPPADTRISLARQLLELED